MGGWPPGSKLLWYLDTSNVSVPDVAAIEDPIAEGVESWMGVCGVRFIRALDRSAAQLVARFVLDLSEDPLADQSQRAPWLAGRELGLTDEPVPGVVLPLVMRLNPRVIGGWTALMLRLVVTHEAGHWLGFDHSPDGTPSCMEAELDQRINTQTPYDIAVAQGVYGTPLPAAA